MKKFIVLFLFVSACLLAQTNVELISHLNDYPNNSYNDIWGYVDQNGNEYALLGVETGTSIVDLSDPANLVEVDFIPGPPSIWRDIKTHETYAYTVTENSGQHDGLQIIDLSDLPNSATLVDATTEFFNSAHNIFIDDGFAYVIGTDGGGGMHIIDLADPENPVETSYYSGSGYIHDVYVWDDTVVACAEDSYDLVDVTDKSNPQLISESAELPGIYAHSGWMTEDKRYFYATEEFNEVDLTVWDLQDRTSWDLVVSSWEMPSNSTIHNLFIKGDYAHISYYSEGYVVLDISDPENPVLVGHYQTPSAWGCYPFLPSGLVIISDIPSGLYVFEFTNNDVPPTISHQEIEDVLNNDPITITANIADNNEVTEALLYYRTIIDGNTGNWNMVYDTDGPAGSTYEFEIPGQEHLTEVEYYFAAIDDNENLATLPDGGSGIDPPGNVPPPDLFSFKIVIAGSPVVQNLIPEGDTTIAKDGVVNFVVNAIDTSGLELNYNWYRNGSLINNHDSTFQYISLPPMPAPRTDSVRVEITNGYNSEFFTWLIFVEDRLTGTDDEITKLTYNLKQNYPNPFNPSTRIEFSIPESEFVKLTVFNALGEKVAVLVNEFLPSGIYEYKFEAKNLSTGIYIARIKAGNYVNIIKMNLLK